MAKKTTTIEKKASKSDKFHLQMLSGPTQQPIDCYIKFISVRGTDKPEFRIAGGKHGAHEFTYDEAEDFMSDPERSHYQIVEA